MIFKSITAIPVLLILLYLLSGCNSQYPAEAHSMHMMQAMDAMMQRTNALKMTGDFDVDFANMMIEHHQGAIDMSEIELKNGSDAQMKDMAQQIIAAQQAEIAKLRSFIQAHPDKAIHPQQMADNSMQAMYDQMKSMTMSGKVDLDFAGMMRMHHQGAVAMAQEELAKGQHTEMKQMAQQMIGDQQREIAEFQAWLDKNQK